MIKKVLLGLVGTIGGLVVLLLIAAGCVVCVPSVREAVLHKGIEIAREKTGMDIDLGRLYLSPFHHSPMVLYRAYKGEGDLPLQVEIDSLFVGHQGEDTLVCVRSLRLGAKVKTEGFRSQNSIDFLSIPITVDTLRLEETTFHSDSLIKTVGVDVVVGELATSSPELNIREGMYPLHGLRLTDVFCGIDLRKKDTVPTAKKDTTPLRLTFDVPDGELRNIHFALTPLDLHVRTGRLAPDALVDVGGNRYDARRLEAGDLSLTIGDKLYLPFDTLYGKALVDLKSNRITTPGLYARSDALGASADLRAATMDLKAMRVDVDGRAAYKGSRATLNGYYDIDDEAYEIAADIEEVDLSPWLKDSTKVALAGALDAKGKGINPKRPMRTEVKLRLDEAIYGPYDLSHSTIEAATDSTTSLAVSTRGLAVDYNSPLPLFPLIERIVPMVKAISDSAIIHSLTSLSDLTALDTIRRSIPAMNAAITLHRGSPIQFIIDRTGLDIDSVSLSLGSDSLRTDIAINASMPDISHPEDSNALRLPAAQAALRLALREGETDASLRANTQLTDGVMQVFGLCTEADFQLDLQREGKALYGDGRLTLDSLSYNAMEFGNRAIDVAVAPSQDHDNALRVDVRSEEIPLDLAAGFIPTPDIALHGAVRLGASVDGLPRKTDISAEVLPVGVRAEYKPYDIQIGLGETPIIMKHNHVDLNGLPIYGADSTFIALTGGLDIDSMRVGITLEADSFAPVKLPKGGPFPVYGELATDINGTVSGPLDSIVADVAVSILPTTDITYPIDKKNLAQVKPHGTVNVRYGTADQALALGGRINVDDGFVRYSPKAYPIMPFHVDSGSHITFNGPIGQTELHVSASQQVKAASQAEGEASRMVEFNTGVRVNGILDSIELRSISFFLEAPNDEVITEELASVDEDTREGLAATLLATGMYMGESNESAHQAGYALTSIINSRINAAMVNSKRGKLFDIDFSSAKTEHAIGETNDLNIAISKSFFQERLKLSVGAALSDNPEAYKNIGFLNNISAEYKLTKNGMFLLRAFGQRDFNNILEGELVKSGAGLRVQKEWVKKKLLNGSQDSISRTYGLTADVDIAWRSNNSIGPNLTLTHTMRNLLGRGETFTIRGNGAYYWALRNRHPGDPKKTDTYKLGVNTSLVFPYLHWLGDNNPPGNTRYMIGYQYENIAGGYGVHKTYGSFTYFIHTSRFITHAFTPFSLSIVRVHAESDALVDKVAAYPQLLKVLAGNEFVPSISYHFTYNDYTSKRTVNTMFDVGVKEGGNILNGLFCAFGRSWNEKRKQIGSVAFDQFVKLTLELHHKFNITDQVCFATRFFAGANIPLGNSVDAPLSEAFYAGGPNSMRGASPYAYGPGNFYSEKYNQNFFHAGDVKLEANCELRFPIVWKLYGAAFVDAGNVWSWTHTGDMFVDQGITDYKEMLELREDLYDGILNNPYFWKQIALGTGAGLRLDLDGLVIRLDLGVAIHKPYLTLKNDKDGKPDSTRPIHSYFNVPTALDALRLNFGIGYPF